MVELKDDHCQVPQQSLSYVCLSRCLPCVSEQISIWCWLL